MSHPPKKIAIVGGGMSGLGSIAAMKEVGLDPVCFEATDKLGGRWRYREETRPGTASVMSTTVSTSSKEVGAASNFPPPKESSPYMSRREMLQYAEQYAKAKDCERHIQLNSEVVQVRRAEDYEDTGRFAVTVKDRVSGETTTDVFDGVVVASGHFAYPRTVTLEGHEKFEGTVMHTHGLKRADVFKGKSVLIVGNGSSGLDAAEVVSSVAKNVYLSSRSGFIALGRQGPNGYPLDYTLLRRYLAWMLDILPLSVCNWYIETFYADTRFDHHLYSVPPKYHVLSKDPVFNDAIGSKLLSGSVALKPGVKRLSEKGALFEGDADVTDVDAIVLATGYDFRFPFLENGLLEVEDGRINLYKCMYPVHLPHGTLGFVGFVNPFGPAGPVAEMQSRHAAQLFAGQMTLPSQRTMVDEVIKRHERNLKRYAPSPMMTNRVDFLSYLDDLGSEIGCKPSLLRCLFGDFPLFLRLVFGPVLPYQYRLEGAFRWEGARDAIFKSHERLLYPLVKDDCPRKGALQVVFEFLGNLVPGNVFNF